MTQQSARPTADDLSPDAAAMQQTFTLYAAQGRAYARNVREKLIDLGSLSERDATFRYQLDGDGSAADGFESPQAALRHLGGSVSFLFLDGQFTALPDLQDEVGDAVRDVPRVDITLDEFGPNELAYDPTV